MKTLYRATVVALAAGILLPVSTAAKPETDKQRLSDLNCLTNEIAKFDGAQWVCSGDLDALAQAIDEIGEFGCSAEQQDNSVLITCGDGTAGVIAGAGTVVMYPEGQIGQVPPVEYNTGPVVVMDATGAVLGRLSYMDTQPWGDDYRIQVFDPSPSNNLKLGRVISDHVSQEVYFATQWHRVYFLTEDCSGVPFVEQHLFGELDGQFLVSSSEEYQQVLFRSYREGGRWEVFSGPDASGNYQLRYRYVPASECITVDVVANAAPAAEYVPAPEITNAQYPARLEQLP